MKKTALLSALVAATFALAPLAAQAQYDKDKKDTMSNSSMSKDTMAKDGMKKDSMAKDNMKKDGMSKDSMKKDEMKK